MLFLLYVVQGMPYGFFVTALPLFLRQAGVSRTSIGFYSVLGLPWFLKFLWAPLIDRFSWSRLGRRKSWIVACTACLVVMLLLLIGEEPVPGTSITLLLFIIFVINLLAATQDIAVDGFAVDSLSPEERGPGNAAQVVGFKGGMLLTGGLFLAFVLQIGWSGMCIGMACISLLILLALLLYPEGSPDGPDNDSHPGLSQIVGSLVVLARRSGFLLALALICTYKTGESLIDAMYKIFLMDCGMGTSTIGILCGGWGLGFSLAGSLLGGWVARRAGRLQVLFWFGVLRAIPLAAIACLPFLGAPLAPWIVYPVTLAEHFMGGMLTTVMFAFMMDLCDRRVGATHYTALAAVEVAGKMGMSFFSGLIADKVGYGYLFCLGAGISILWPWLVAVSRRRIVL